MHPPPPTPHGLTTAAPADRTGAPVLCLHGLFAGSWVFDRLLPLIAARGYPASALSYRGHPPEPALRDIGRQSLADFARDASDAAHALDRPIVIGHSLGGLVALLLAGQGLVRAAVLVSPAPPRGISVLSPAILRRMASYVPSMLFSRGFLPSAEHLDALVLNEVPATERASIRERFVPDSGRAARQIALGMYNVPKHAIRAPMLVVASGNDRFIPPGVSRRVAKRYGAQLYVAEGHGHFLFSEPGWEREAEFILDWIDALPRAVREPSPAIGGGENQERASRVHQPPTHSPAPEPT